MLAKTKTFNGQGRQDDSTNAGRKVTSWPADSIVSLCFSKVIDCLL